MHLLSWKNLYQKFSFFRGNTANRIGHLDVKRWPFNVVWNVQRFNGGRAEVRLVRHNESAERKRLFVSGNKIAEVRFHWRDVTEVEVNQRTSRDTFQFSAFRHFAVCIASVRVFRFTLQVFSTNSFMVLVQVGR